MANLSLSSMAGFSSPKTIKVKGMIKGCEVVVLIDGGATQNFIAEELVADLQLLVSPMEGYSVVLGIDGSVCAAGICKRVHLIISNLSIIHDFLPLPLGVNVILEVAWLETLGKIEIDYQSSVMNFCVGNWMVELQGDWSLVRSQVSLRLMMKAFTVEDQGLLVELKCDRTRGKNIGSLGISQGSGCTPYRYSNVGSEV